LQGSLVGYFLYRAVRYVETPSPRNAVLIGLSLGALTLTRGLLTPVTLTLALLLCTRLLALPLGRTVGHLGLAGAAAAAIAAIWMVPAALLLPPETNPVSAWLHWNASQIGFPTWLSIKTFVRTGTWFFWPAWPFAGWAIYAWRRQNHLLHIVLPLSFVGALTLLIMCDPLPENGDLLKLLPPLAIMAAFGLPTMKRGAINAIDWFSVMVLTMLASILWLFWIAKLTGWPEKLAHNLLKRLPGFLPEFGWLPFLVAASATIGWIFLVRWRISRQPSVLWRAVVLSSGGLILLWVMLLTLFLPDINYSKNYASVAREVASKIPPGTDCIDSNVGLPQRASFMYYAALPFSKAGARPCRMYLLQDSVKVKDNREKMLPDGAANWEMLWEGRRSSDRDERFRLYRRLP
jgi:4-amino-4-deoxy-L-arabinose transferase-like glycosyltransferase